MFDYPNWQQEKDEQSTVIAVFERIMKEAGASFRVENAPQIYRVSRWSDEHGTSAHRSLLEKHLNENHRRNQ